MKFKKYQAKALETALPTVLTPSYLIPMIIGEIGDCFGKVAKAVRDDWSEERLNEELTKECGDVCWGVALLAKHYGLTKIERWGTDYHLKTREESLHFLLADVSTLEGITRGGGASGRAQVRHLWLNLEDNCELLTGHSFDKVLNMSLKKIADHKVSNDISGSEPLMADPTPQNEAQSASAHPGDEPIYTKRNNKMTTAIKLREIEYGRQAEYRFDHPITVTALGETIEVTHLISSHSAIPGFVGHETVLFPSDGNGNIIRYLELYSMSGHLYHDEAVQNFLKENTHEQTSHHPQQPCTHLGTQKPGEQEMSTEPKVYTAVEVASAGPGQKEIDQTLAEVTQEAYEAAKKVKPVSSTTTLTIIS